MQRVADRGDDVIWRNSESFRVKFEDNRRDFPRLEVIVALADMLTLISGVARHLPRLGSLGDRGLQVPFC